MTRSKKIKEIVGKNCWKTGLSNYIDEGERFYIVNKLNDEEIKGINDLNLLFLGEHQKDYEKNLMLQLLIKSFYILTKVLSLSMPEHLEAAISLYSVNSNLILENQKSVFQNIIPIWRHKSE